MPGTPRGQGHFPRGLELRPSWWHSAWCGRGGQALCVAGTSWHAWPGVALGPSGARGYLLSKQGAPRGRFTKVTSHGGRPPTAPLASR